MTIEYALEYFMDEMHCEVFDLDTGNILFEGSTDDIPTKYLLTNLASMDFRAEENGKYVVVCFNVSAGAGR